MAQRQPTPAAPSLLDEALAQMKQGGGAVESQPPAPSGQTGDVGPQTIPKPKIYSGGAVSDVFDLLGTVLLTYPTTAAVKAAARGENPLAAAAKTFAAGLPGSGVDAERPTYEDVLEARGMQPGKLRTGLGLVLDIALDPAWVVTPAKILKLMNKVGPVAKATSAIGETVSKSTVGRKFTELLTFPLERAAAKKTPGAVEAFEKQEARLTELAKLATEQATSIRKQGKKFENYLVEAAEAKTPAQRTAIFKAAKDAGIEGGTLLKTYDDAIKLREETALLAARLSGHTAGAIEKVVLELGEPRANREILSKLVSGGPTKAFPKDYVQEVMKDISKAGIAVSEANVRAAQHVARLEFFEEMRKLTSTHATGEFTRKIVDNSSQYGALAGKFVPTWLGDIADILSKPQNKWEKAISEPLGIWKAFKTVFSPAAAFRQLPGNMLISTALGPMPAYRLLDTFARGPALLMGKGSPEALKAMQFIREAQGSFPAAELNRMYEVIAAGGHQGFLQTIRRGIHAASQPASTFYQFFDNWAKAAMIEWATGPGMRMGAREAARLAQASLFNYSRVPKAVALARSNGIVPFASFSYFATRGTARAIWSRPAGLGQVFKAVNAVERQNPDLMEQKAAMPPWMKQFGQVLLPSTDHNGNRVIFNATYMLPFQSAASAGERGLFAEAMSSIPLFSLLSEIGTGKSTFTGRDIIPREELYGSEARKRGVYAKRLVQHVYQFAMPSWMPSIIPFKHPTQQFIRGGYAFQNLEDAVTKRPDVFGDTKGWWQTAMGEVFGLKTRGFNYSREQRKRVFEYKDRVKYVHKRMELVARDPELSDEQRSKIMDNLQKDLLAVHQDWVLSQGGDLDE